MRFDPVPQRFSRRTVIGAPLALGLAGSANAVAPRVLNARDFGAKGDGRNDDYPALQRFFDTLAETGGRGDIPEGVYLCSNHPSFENVDPPATIRIRCYGTLRMTAKGRWGTTVLIRNSRKIEWEGGTLDGGDPVPRTRPFGNNGLSMSGLLSTGQRATSDVHVHGITLVNCRASVEYLGGKGFSLQRGVENCSFQIEVRNCDFGATLESSAVDERSFVRGITLGVRATDCRYAGLLLMQGVQRAYSDSATVMSATIRASLHDCGTWEADGTIPLNPYADTLEVERGHFLAGDTVRFVDQSGRAMERSPVYARGAGNGPMRFTRDHAGNQRYRPSAGVASQAMRAVPDGWAAILFDRAQNLDLEATLSTSRTQPMTLMRGRVSNSRAQLRCSYPRIYALWDPMRHGLRAGRIPSLPGAVPNVDNDFSFELTGCGSEPLVSPPTAEIGSTTIRRTGANPRPRCAE